MEIGVCHTVHLEVAEARTSLGFCDCIIESVIDQPKEREIRIGILTVHRLQPKTSELELVLEVD